MTLSERKLNQKGMVRDFGDLKETIGRWIDENLDHWMILAKEDPLTGVLRELGEPVFLTESDPTAESLAKLLYDVAEEAGFPIRRVEFWETPKCRAIYERDAE